MSASATFAADAVRQDLRGYVAEHLGEPDGVLIIEETNCLKDGDHSAGVHRQYTATAGRIENYELGCSSPSRAAAATRSSIAHSARPR